MDTQVQIPGYMVATINETTGAISGYTFTPAVADAGYFGNEIIHIEGDKISSEEFFELVSTSLTLSKDEQSTFILVEWTC